MKPHSYRLRDLLTLTKDGEWGKSEPADGHTKMLVVRGTDFAGVRLGELSTVPTRFIPDRVALRKQLRAGDILIETAGGSRDRPTGRTVHLPDRLFSLSPLPITCASFSRFLRVNEELVEPEYLFWYLQWLYESGQMANYQVQHTGVARFQYTIFAEAISIPLPNLVEQRAIAQILGTLDDKIELNRRLSQTLEELARALFTSWFVTFDPVRAKAAGRTPEGMDAATAALFPDEFEDLEQGELPSGWGFRPLAEFVDINSWTLRQTDELDRIDYVDISSVMRGTISDVQQYVRGTEPSRARRRLRHGDTVLSTVRPDRGSYFLCLTPTQNLIASTGFAVLTPRDVSWGFVHAAVTQAAVFEYLGHEAHGGAYPAVSTERIGAWRVATPANLNIVQTFGRLGEPLFERAAASRAESRVLATIRDVLLPKLLSGDLQISEGAERVLEAVGKWRP